jgi:hypothetical protein
MRLLRADLFHQGVIIPEEVFLGHCSLVIPMSERRHRQVISLASRLNGFASGENHGFGKRTIEITHDAGPLAVRSAETHWVLDNAIIRCERPHKIEFLDVRGNSLRRMAIRVINNDVFRMALGEIVPVLPGVDVDI